MLVITTTEVDKSGASYYGEQHLYYLTVKGDGFMVPLGKTFQASLLSFIQ